jgi:hypothetical protein
MARRRPTGSTPGAFRAGTLVVMRRRVKAGSANVVYVLYGRVRLRSRAAASRPQSVDSSPGPWVGALRLAAGRTRASFMVRKARRDQGRTRIRGSKSRPLGARGYFRRHSAVLTWRNDRLTVISGWADSRQTNWRGFP